MGSLPLVAGERLVRSLRPHPLAFGHLYALPLAAAAWGLLLLAIFTEPAYLAAARADFLIWYGNEVPLSYLLWTLGLVGMALLSQRFSRGLRWPLLTLGFTLVWAVSVPFLFPLAIPAALAWGTSAFGAAGLLLVEAHRRTHRYHLTDRRLVLEGGLWKRRDAQHPLSSVKGLEAHQTLPGRLLRFGTLVPRVEGPSDPGTNPPPALCLYGIRPFGKVRVEVLNLIEGAHRPAVKAEPFRLAPAAPAAAAAVSATDSDGTALSRIEEILGATRAGGDAEGAAPPDLDMTRFMASIHED